MPLQQSRSRTLYILRVFLSFIFFGSVLMIWVNINLLLWPFLGSWLIFFNLLFVPSYLSLVFQAVDRPLLPGYAGKDRFLLCRQSSFFRSNTARGSATTCVVRLSSKRWAHRLIQSTRHLISCNPSSRVGSLRMALAEKIASRVRARQVHHRSRPLPVSSLTIAVFALASLFYVGLATNTILPNAFTARAATTYVWQQTTWEDGVSGSIARHDEDLTGWSHMSQIDGNIIIDGSGNISMDTTVQELGDSTTADFKAGSRYNCEDGVCIAYDENSLILLEGYPLDDFLVTAEDLSGTHNWSNAMSNCDNLCSGCELPDINTLEDIYDNRASLGNNFQSDHYWSSTWSSMTFARGVNFSNGDTYNHDRSNSYYVRCIRR